MGRTKRCRKRHRDYLITKNINVFGRDDNTTHVNVELLKLLIKDQGWSNETRLRVKYFWGTGRGLYSKYNLYTDETIIKLPFDLIISIKTIESDDVFINNFVDLKLVSKVISLQSLLALYLLYLKHKDTQWSPYIATLPAAFTNPYFLRKEELYCIHNNLLEKIVVQNNKIKHYYEMIVKLLKPDSTFLRIIDLAQFKWSYFVVNTRSIYLKPQIIVKQIQTKKIHHILDDEPNMGLAPYLDLFNHSDDAQMESQLLHMQEGLIFQLVAKKLYKKNQQIYINYGCHDNAKLLLEYGFFLNRNRHDFIEITMSDLGTFIKCNAKLKKMSIPSIKFKYIKDHNLDIQMFFNTEDLCSHNLLIILYFLFVDETVYPTEFDQVCFGNTPEIDDLKSIIKDLLDYKRNEFETCLRGKSKLDELSESGRIYFSFVTECLLLLNEISIKLI